MFNLVNLANMYFSGEKATENSQKRVKKYPEVSTKFSKMGCDVILDQEIIFGLT